MEFRIHSLNISSNIKLVGENSKPAPRGIAQLFSLSSIRKSRSEKVKKVCVAPWIQSGFKWVQSLFQVSTPSSLPTTITNQTPIYEYKPPLAYLAATCDHCRPQTFKTPESLLCVGRKERRVKGPTSGYGVLFSNLNLTLKGRLARTREGTAFLIIEPMLYQTLRQVFQVEKSDAPDFHKKLGPNIPIIAEGESPSGYITEIGRDYSFSIEEAYLIEPSQWTEVQQAFVVEIHCPELYELRSRYRLPEKLKGHPFHLILGMEKAHATQPKQPDCYFKINGAHQWA